MSVTVLCLALYAIRFQGSRATIEALRAMLHEAESGRMIGLAYVAMYNHREYGIGIKGETRNSPTFTRGMLHVLDDELANIITNGLK